MSVSDPSSFVSELQGESASTRWTRVCNELERALPAEPAEATRALASWAPVLDAAFRDEDRFAPTEWFAEVERAEPESYDDYPGLTTFRRLLPEPHRAWPVVRQVSLCFDQGLDDRHLDEIGARDQFGSVTGLSLRITSPSPDVLERFLSSVCLGRVERLAAFWLDFRGRRATVFAASELARRLTAVYFGWNHLEPQGLESILAACRAPLRSLTLENESGVGAAGAAVLARSAPLASLERLALRGVRLGSSGARALASTPLDTRLRALDLEDGGFDGGEMGVEGAGALGRSKLLDGLKQLRIGYHALGADGLRALLAHPGLGSLESLEVMCSALGDDGCRVIAGAKHLASLRRLSLSYNSISKEGEAVLARAPQLARTEIHVFD